MNWKACNKNLWDFKKQFIWEWEQAGEGTEGDEERTQAGSLLSVDPWCVAQIHDTEIMTSVKIRSWLL